MTDFITVTELAAYLQDDTVTGDTADLFVELANELVTDVTGTMDDPYPAKVRAIVFEVAARAFRNPEGYSSETIDDYTYRRDADTRRAGVYLTDSERAELAGSPAGVVRMGWLA